MKVGRSSGRLLAVGLLLLIFAFAHAFAFPSFFALPKAFAGSPFYLTVEKSFSNTEKPQLRLDYTNTRKPILVRVLRPGNLDRFLDGQLHISRSYEKPITELNPGYYFIRGLNRVELPLKDFREMLDTDFRKSFNDTSFHKALLDTVEDQIASVPEQIIHGPPDGFSVVREYYIDLEYGGKDVSDLGWWFVGSAWKEDSYKIRKISLDVLPDGIYQIQAVQGKTEAQCLLQVSSLSVQVKQSTEQLVVRVIDRQLSPVSGASISYRDGRGKWIGLGQKTNAFGEVSFSNPQGTLDGKLVIKVEASDKRQALVDTDFLPAVSNDDPVFIVTDRPIFKPGETFFYKGVVRAFEKGELKTPDFADKQAGVSLIRADGTATGLQATVPLTGFGSFSGAFGLDDSQTPGIYRLVAEISGKPYGGEFRVRDYVKPTFYLELADRSPTIVPGERFFIKFRAKRYSGGVPKDVKFEVFLYRKKFEAPQWVTESGGGLSAGKDYHGEVRSASGLTEPKRIYSSIETRLTELSDLYVTNTWDSAPKMDESGEARFEIDIPKIDSGKEEEWIYTLMVRAIDRAGSQAVLAENLYVTLSEAQPTVRFSEAIAQAGQKGITVSVRSTYPDGKPAPKAGGALDIFLEVGREGSKDFVKLPFTTDDKGISQLAVPELKSRGRLRAVATLETLDGKPMKRSAKSEPALMIVGGAQGETVLENEELELYTANTILSPGDKAKVFALLPANWGKAESGAIWETLSGRKVYDARASEFKGRSRWFEVEAKPEYGTGFYHTVTVPMSGGKYREQTLGFRIVPWSKRLLVTATPEREETEPLKPFKIDLEVKDSKGAPWADTELAVTIVDKAVYAVQPELRPGIFDFFYPLPRLNLATFYSDELQGYGYADILKKPNFKLGALKSQSKITKKAMRDTAGFFPHVVTDANGRASITVDLPANVTEWLITAIATDKDGRVGEAKGKFRTVADISVEVLGPQFLREGEEASFQVRTTNHLARDISVTSKLGLNGEATLKAGARESEFTLEKQGENLQPLLVEAKGGKGEATFTIGLAAKEDVHVGGVEEFDIPLKLSGMRQVFAGVQGTQGTKGTKGDQEKQNFGDNGKRDVLFAELPATAKISELKVQVSSGLLGAALNAAAVLVSYPYGCTEQLVHSTIPNLVLMDLVRRAGITPDQLGPLEGVLIKAEKNAASGIKKIMGNQKTDGGFGLWPSDRDSTLPVTLTAVSALKLAGELKVEGAQRALYKGFEWLERIKEENMAGDRTLVGYELVRFADTGIYQQPWNRQIAYVESLQKDPYARLDDLIYGLKLFAGQQDKEWTRFNQRFKDTTVREELIERVKKALDELDPEVYAKTTTGESSFFQAFGFRSGIPCVVSAGLGALDDLKALPDGLKAKLEQILLSYMRNGYWISTFDTAQVIFNTRALLSREAAACAGEEKAKSRKIVITAKDGSQLGELARIPSGFVGGFTLPGKPENLSQIQLEGLAATDVAYSAITADIPYGSLKPHSQGLVVERTFRRITPTGSEPLDLSFPLHKGDLVVSEVRVRRGPLRYIKALPSRFLVVEDGVPSIAQAIDNDEVYLADAKIQPKEDSYWGSIKETQRYPEKTVRIAKVSPTGEIIVYQVWQAAFTGKAYIPPARAFDMYDESVQSNTEALSVRAE